MINQEVIVPPVINDGSAAPPAASGVE